MPALDPNQCTEVLDPNQTIGTFSLSVRQAGAASAFDVGNITTGGFQITPTVIDSRSGIDGSLLSIFRTGTDYTINFTANYITIRNLAMILNEDFGTVAGGCEIPLTGDRCVKEYGVLLSHDFPCQGKSLNIEFWRAAILVDTTVAFDLGAPNNFPGVFRALNCASAHPTRPFGRVFVSEACPIS
jgi:hypothetical protein